jgi:hypothetical protein
MKTKDYKLSESSSLPKIISRKKDGSYTVHDQIIHFVDGHKRYIKGVKWVWENEMLHLVTENNNEFIINKDKVLFVQRRLEFDNDQL